MKEGRRRLMPPQDRGRKYAEKKNTSMYPRTCVATLGCQLGPQSSAIVYLLPLISSGPQGDDRSIERVGSNEGWDDSWSAVRLSCRPSTCTPQTSMTGLVDASVDDLQERS